MFYLKRDLRNFLLKLVLSLFTIVKFDNEPCYSSSGDSGICMTSTECYQNRGVPIGSCANSYGVCCLCKIHTPFLVYIYVHFIKILLSITCLFIILNSADHVRSDHPRKWHLFCKCRLSWWFERYRDMSSYRTQDISIHLSIQVHTYVENATDMISKMVSFNTLTRV